MELTVLKKGGLKWFLKHIFIIQTYILAVNTLT